MALFKDHYITLDLKRTPKVALQNIVAGETGNRLIITLTNGDDPIALDSTNYRVALRVTSALGVRRQDSAASNNGITFENGKAIILLSKDSYTANLNRAALEVYSTESETDDTLVVSAEFMFYAKGMDDGENVGTAIPLLVHYEMLARSWAEGGTGIREGEDENNARFWAELSNAIAIPNGSITNQKLSAYVQSKLNDIITQNNYADLQDGEDWTEAIQTAIDENRCVFITKNIKIHGTVKIPASKTIFICGCAVEKPATSDNDAPVFWLGNTYASLVGIGAGSWIRDRRPSPDGVVKVGAKSNTEVDANASYCRVMNLTIAGSGNSSIGEDVYNVGLHMCGTYDQVTPNAYCSYFNKIANLFMLDCERGIVINNASNANVIQNIHFTRCGHDNVTGAFCFIRTQGSYHVQRIPCENVIDGAFHHDSRNSTTLYIGTALGYNRIVNIVCEQDDAQGTSSHVIYVDPNETNISSMRNTFKFTNNSRAGVYASDEWKAKNNVESQTAIRHLNFVADNNVSTKTLTLDGEEYHDTKTQRFFIENSSGLSANTEYEIAQIPAGAGTKYFGSIIRITASTYAGVAALSLYTQTEYLVKFNGIGAANRVVTELGTPLGDLDLTIDSTGLLRMKLPDVASAPSTNVKIYLEIIGTFPSSGLSIKTGFKRSN